MADVTRLSYAVHRKRVRYDKAKEDEKACLFQLSSTTCEANPWKLEDHVSKLPNEILVRIFGQLEISDLGSTAQVCQQWRTCAYVPELWRHVDVTQFAARFNDAALGYLLRRATRLESLRLDGTQVTAVGLVPLSRVAQTLVSLSMKNCYRVTDGACLLLARLTRLRELNTSGCSGIESRTHQQRLATLQNLRDVTTTSRLATVLSTRGSSFPRLTTLVVTEPVTYYDIHDFLQGLESFPALQVLHFGITWQSRIVQPLAALQNLVELDLERYSSTAFDVDNTHFLASLSRLRVLRIPLSSFTAQLLLNLRNLVNLAELSVSTTSVALHPDDGLLFPKSLQSLDITITDPAGVAQVFEQATDLKRFALHTLVSEHLFGLDFCNLSFLHHLHIDLQDAHRRSGDDLSALWCGLLDTNIEVVVRGQPAVDWAQSGRSHLVAPAQFSALPPHMVFAEPMGRSRSMSR